LSGVFAHDANGNLAQSATATSGGTIATNYVYEIENRLVSASGGATEPALRSARPAI
jgi:hypothetical protein